MLGRVGWAEKNLPSWVGHIWWHCQVQLQQIFNLTTTTIITRTFCDVGSLWNQNMKTDVRENVSVCKSHFLSKDCLIRARCAVWTRKTQPKAANFQLAHILVKLRRKTIENSCQISNQTRSNRPWEGWKHSLILSNKQIENQLLGEERIDNERFTTNRLTTNGLTENIWAKNGLTTKDWQQKDWQETDL